MVLQQQPAKACVYGLLGDGGTAASVKIASVAAALNSTGSASPDIYEMNAEISADGNGFKACLPPKPAGGSYVITATCTGCQNTTNAVLEDVTYGDVWYCGGQS